MSFLARVCPISCGGCAGLHATGRRANHPAYDRSHTFRASWRVELSQLRPRYVMTVVLASNPADAEAPLPAIDVRALSKRLAVPAEMAALALAAVLLGGGRVHAFVEGLRRGLGVSPGWAALGVALEVVSLAGYVPLLSFGSCRPPAR